MKILTIVHKVFLEDTLMGFAEVKLDFLEMKNQLKDEDEEGLGLHLDGRLFWRKRLSELQSEMEEKYDTFFRF